MVTATISSKGQIVIPVEIRKKMGLNPGDKVVIEVDESGRQAQLRRRETLEEMSARFTSWIKPGTPPLLDASAFYETRKPRL